MAVPVPVRDAVPHRVAVWLGAADLVGEPDWEGVRLGSGVLEACIVTEGDLDTSGVEEALVDTDCVLLEELERVDVGEADTDFVADGERVVDLESLGVEEWAPVVLAV